MKLNKIAGTCFYYHYGSGGHQSLGIGPFSIQGQDIVNSSGKWVTTIRATHNFKLHRGFVDTWIIVPEKESNNQSFTLKDSPTEQNFLFEDYFKLMKANGITNVMSLSGCFDWFKPFMGSFSQRKSACYDPRLDPSDPNAWKDFAHLCKLVAQKYNNTGLVDYIQCLNEWDFRWNVARVITPEEYAVCFKSCYDAIRSVSSTQGIAAGCTLTPDLDTYKRFTTKLKALYQSEGKSMPTDWIYTFNNYIRTETQNQGSGIGATAEEVDRYNKFFKPLNDLITQDGVDGFMCTESGWNSSPSTSATAMKNKAPKLEGYTLEEAQGILAIRLALIMGSLPKCKGITFYHCKDGYEAEPFTYHGWNYDKDFGGKPDWSSKPGKTIVEQFLEKYGEYEVESFYEMNGYYYADIGETILGWTNITKKGALTPMPQIALDTPTPSKTDVTVNITGDTSKVNIKIQ